MLKKINFNKVYVLIPTIAASIAIYQSIDYFKNPRAKLSESGISWKNENFIAAIESNDIETIKLFSKGGMKLNSYYFNSFLAKNYSNEIKNIFIKNKVLDSNSCPTDHNLNFYIAYAEHTQKQNVIKSVCNTPAVINQLNQLLAKEEQKEKEYIKEISKKDYLIANCIKRNSDIGSDLGKTLDEINSSKLLEKSIFNERESILLAIQSNMSLSLNYKIQEQAMKQQVKEICKLLNQRKKFNSTKMTSIRNAITSLTEI